MGVPPIMGVPDRPRGGGVSVVRGGGVLRSGGGVVGLGILGGKPI